MVPFITLSPDLDFYGCMFMGHLWKFLENNFKELRFCFACLNKNPKLKLYHDQNSFTVISLISDNFPAKA